MTAVVVVPLPSPRGSALSILVELPTVLITYKGSLVKSSFTRESKNDGEESLRVNNGGFGCARISSLVSRRRNFGTTAARTEARAAGAEWG